MSSSWSWKSTSENTVVRKTEDGQQPGGGGGGGGAIESINGDSTPNQIIAGAAGIDVENLGSGIHSLTNTGVLSVASSNSSIFGTGPTTVLILDSYADTIFDGGEDILAFADIKYKFFEGTNYEVIDINFNVIPNLTLIAAETSADWTTSCTFLRTGSSTAALYKGCAIRNIDGTGPSPLLQYTRGSQQEEIPGGGSAIGIDAASVTGSLFMGDVPKNVVTEALGFVLQLLADGANAAAAFSGANVGSATSAAREVTVIDSVSEAGDLVSRPSSVILPSSRSYTSIVSNPPSYRSVETLPRYSIRNSSSVPISVSPQPGGGVGEIVGRAPPSVFRLAPGHSATFQQVLPPNEESVEGSWQIIPSVPALSLKDLNAPLKYSSSNPNSVLPLSQLMDYSKPIRSTSLTSIYTGNVPYPPFDNSPSLVVTPNFTGFYRIYACPTFTCTDGSNRFTIEATVGEPNQISRNAGGLISGSGNTMTLTETVESWFNLEAGHIYQFDICGFSNGTGMVLQGSPNDGTATSGSEFNIWAEQLTNAFYISPAFPGNSNANSSATMAGFTGTGYPFLFTFTCLSTGLHKVYSSIRCVLSTPGMTGWLKIICSAGVPSGAPIYRLAAVKMSNTFLNTTYYVESLFYLTMGNTYTFQLQGQVSSGAITLAPLTGTSGSTFMFAEEVPTLSNSPPFASDVSVTSTTYTPFSGVSWAFNPNFSGVHKVTALVPIENTNNATGNFVTCQMDVTSGAVFDILSNNEATVSMNTTATPMKSCLLQMLVLVQAGATYNFIIKGVSKPAGSVTLKGTVAPFYFTAEEAFLSGIQSINGDFNNQQIIIGNNYISTNTANGTTTLSLITPIDVPGGGTGKSTLNAHQLLLGNGTGNVVQPSTGTSGQVLTSNGSSSDPSFQTLNVGVTSVSTSAPANYFLSSTVTNPTSNANIAFANSGFPLQINNTSVASTGNQEIKITNTNTNAALETGFGAFADGGTSVEMLASSTTNQNRGIVRTAANAGLDLNAQGASKSIRLMTNSTARATIDDNGLSLQTPLPVASGGTGVNSFTGLATGNGTNPWTSTNFGYFPQANYIPQWDPETNLKANNFKPNFTTITADQTLTSFSSQILQLSSGGGNSVTLPDGNSLLPGFYFTFYTNGASWNIKNSAGTTIATTSSNTITTAICSVATTPGTWIIYTPSSGGGGSVTSVGLTAPSAFTVSGSPVTSSGTLALSYSGTAIPVTSGGTGQTSLTSGQLVVGNGTSGVTAQAFGTTPAASTVAQWDANANLSADNVIKGFSNVNTNTVPSTTLTINSLFQQFFNGTATGDVTLPTTCPIGTTFRIVNITSQLFTINTSPTIVLNPNEECLVTALVANPTSSQWNASRKSNATSPLPVPQGGTGQSTLTSHGVLIGNGTSAVNATSAGTSGQVLTSNGASADPTFQTLNVGVTSINGDGTAAQTIAAGTGLSINNSGATHTLSLSTPVSIANGGTGVTVVTTTKTPSAWTGWDADGNIDVGNIITDYTSFTAATFTVAKNSPMFIEYTGSGNTVITMPLNSTLKIGWTYWIRNSSSGSGTVTVNTNGGALIKTLLLADVASFVCKGHGTNPTTNWTVNNWNVNFQPDSNGIVAANAFNSGFLDSTGNVTMTAASAPIQRFHGSGAKTLTLPVLSTLALGYVVYVLNEGTGAVTVQTSGANTIATVNPSNWGWFRVNTASGVGAANWDYLTVSRAFQPDNNNNATINNIILGYNTSSTDVTITAASPPIQRFTGSTAKTLTMPVASTLVTGYRVLAINDGSGLLTIAASGGGTIVTAAQDVTVFLTLVTASGTSAASWTYQVASKTLNPGTVTSVALTAPSAFTVSGSPVTSSGTLALSYSGTAIPVTSGGTGQTTLTASQLVVGNGTSGVTGQSYGASPGPAKVPQWDTNSNLSTDNLIYGFSNVNTNTLPSSTLTIDSVYTQFFNGTAVGDVTLPTTCPIGTMFRIVNTTTQLFTINTSPATILNPNEECTVTALVANPTNAQWNASRQSNATAPLPVNQGGTGASTLTSGQLVVGNGTSAVTGQAYGTTATASQVLQRDANANTFANAYVQNVTTVASGGTQNLTAASSPVQRFTGSTNTIVNLPTGTSVGTGFTFTFISQSAQLTIQNSDSSVSWVYSPTSTQVSTQIPAVTATCTVAGTPGTWNVFQSVLANKFGNPVANNIVLKLTTTATAAGTTSLTNSSTYRQVFTGTQTQTVKLPTNVPGITTGGSVGSTYLILNQSTQSLSIQTFSAAAVFTQPPDTIFEYLQTGSTDAASSWLYTPSGSASGGPLPVAIGGTGASTFTSGQFLKGNGTGTVTTQATTGSGNVVLDTNPVLNSPSLSGDTTCTGVLTAVAYRSSTQTLTANTTLNNNSPGVNNVTTSGINVTLNNTFSAGELLTVLNNSGGDINVKANNASNIATLHDGAIYQVINPAANPATPTDWLTIALRSPPNVQRFISAGSFTYTTPTFPSPIYLIVELLGGGGGGGSSTNGSGGAGGNGGDSVFGSATAVGGKGGPGGGQAALNGANGTEAYTTIHHVPSSPTPAFTFANFNVGGAGFVTSAYYGANSIYGYGGIAAQGAGGDANGYGAGGGAGEAVFGSSQAANSGAAACYLKFMVSSPLSSTYSVTVGAAGAKGTGGSNDGGLGSPGLCVVTAYYH